MNNIFRPVSYLIPLVLLVGTTSTQAIAQDAPLNLNVEIRNTTLACLKSIEANQAGLSALQERGYKVSKKRDGFRYKKSPHKTVFLNVHSSVFVESKMTRRGQTQCLTTIVVVSETQSEKLYKLFKTTITNAGYRKATVLDYEGKPKQGYAKGNTKFLIGGSKKFIKIKSGTENFADSTMWISRSSSSP
jgi:hypothetical protein